MQNNYEIMAPVGSYESLAAAFQAKADSVYFGVENLNMRSHSSNNFTLTDLHNISGLCKEKRVKSYLTVNTVMYDGDLDTMRQIIDEAKKAGISAIIASDVAAMTYAVKTGVEVHLSTQLNISNVESLKFYSQFADVVVLARELNLNQIAYIAGQIEEQNITGPGGNKIRIEMFCHGALCMAVSGKCYLSLHEYNASANRGNCFQICRRAYDVKDRETGLELQVDNKYIMSPKDLKTIHFMNKMLDAGVKVFKIEGRARGAEYVKTVVSCYREAIESYKENTFTEEKIKDWNKRLATVFNRGFWDGYYLGQRLGEWTDKYGSSATEKKIRIGHGVKYFSKLKVAEFIIDSYDLKVGDKILITGPTTGALYSTIEELRVDLKAVQKATKGTHVSFKIEEKIRPSDTLYRIVTEEKGKSYM